MNGSRHNFSASLTARRSSSAFKIVKSAVFRMSHQLKICDTVIGLIVVLMVNNFVWFKNASKMGLHYKAMLKHNALSLSRMIGSVNSNVSVTVKRSTSFPFMTLFSLLGESVPLQSWKRIALKVAFVSVGGFRGFCWFTTAALTQTRRYFTRIGDIRGVLSGHFFTPFHKAILAHN